MMRRGFGVVVMLSLVLFAAAGAFAAGERADVSLPGGPAKSPVVHPAPSGTAPANDDCTGAIAIGAFPFSSTVDTTAATIGTEPAAECTDTGATIWYRYTNNSGYMQAISANTFASDPMDTVLEAFTGTCAALVPLACNDDASGLQSAVSFQVAAGQTVYLRAGGFQGETGNLTLDVPSAITYTCPEIAIAGVLGSGSPSHPGTSGTQNARLNRNGIASTCDTPKACNIFATGTFNYDAYTLANESGDPQCVSVELEVTDETGCNLESDAYLGSFDPANICTNYLADPGLSSGTPPTNTNMSFEVPSGGNLVIDVHSTNAGELGCNYVVHVLGNTCPQVSVIEVPTLDHWGLGALAALLLGGALFLLSRQRRAA